MSASAAMAAGTSPMPRPPSDLNGLSPPMPLAPPSLHPFRLDGRRALVTGAGQRAGPGDRAWARRGRRPCRARRANERRDRDARRGDHRGRRLRRSARARRDRRSRQPRGRSPASPSATSSSTMPAPTGRSRSARSARTTMTPSSTSISRAPISSPRRWPGACSQPSGREASSTCPRRWAASAPPTAPSIA